LTRSTPEKINKIINLFKEEEEEEIRVKRVKREEELTSQ
jgi:hypothetical protein